jgi:hypothetical protein
MIMAHGGIAIHFLHAVTLSILLTLLTPTIVLRISGVFR